MQTTNETAKSNKERQLPINTLTHTPTKSFLLSLNPFILVDVTHFVKLSIFLYYFVCNKLCRYVWKYF